MHAYMHACMHTHTHVHTNTHSIWHYVKQCQQQSTANHSVLVHCMHYLLHNSRCCVCVCILYVCGCMHACNTSLMQKIYEPLEKLTCKRTNSSDLSPTEDKDNQAIASLQICIHWCFTHIHTHSCTHARTHTHTQTTTTTTTTTITTTTAHTHNNNNSTHTTKKQTNMTTAFVPVIR